MMGGQAHNLARTIQADQGWTNSTLLDIVLDFIDCNATDDKDAFAAYLMGRTAGDDDDSGL